MTYPINQSLNAHLTQLDNEDEREEAIANLAERLMFASKESICEVLAISNYSDLTGASVRTAIAESGEDDFFYSLAENLINRYDKSRG